MQEFTDAMVDEFCSTYNYGDINEYYYLFDEMLDECYPAVELLGIEYSLSHILPRIDEIHYDQCANSYLNDYLVEIACGVYALPYDVDRFLSEYEED